MRRYERYKDSGVAWVGKIPVGWKVTKLRQIFTERSTKVSDKDYPALSVGYMGVVPQLDTAAKTENGDNRKLICKGDFAINSRSDRKGAGGISEYIGSASMIITVIKPHENINGKFYHYLLRSHYFSEEFYRNGRGLVADLWTTRWDTMRNILSPLPPLSEQNQIVNFLDYKVSRIDKLISIRQRQITELEDLKKTIISKAVTKGDWKRVRLKNLVKLISEKTSSPNLKYIGMENIESWTGKFIETEEIIPESVSNKFYKGDILFGKLRPYLAKVFLAPSDGICSSEFLVLRSKEFEAKFLRYCLISYKFIDVVNSSTYGAKMPRANWQFIGNCLLPVPSLAEQNQIAAYLDKKCAQIDKAISNTQRQIAELNDLKARLISDAVTGKIDIR